MITYRIQMRFLPQWYTISTTMVGTGAAPGVTLIVTLPSFDLFLLFLLEFPLQLVWPMAFSDSFTFLAASVKNEVQDAV